jgi:hypothetical protein
MLIGLESGEIERLGPFLSQLPKKVRLVGEAPETGGADDPSNDLYEFEVVMGNASYKEGERFYLTPAQAQRAYFSTLHN